jgi:hypothetical protein
MLKTCRRSADELHVPEGGENVRKAGIGSSWGERSRAQTVGTLLTVALAAGIAVTAGGPAPAADDGPQVSAPGSDLVRFAGGPPDRCVYSAPDRALCRWRIEGRLIRRGHADPRAVPGGVNLVCDVPIGAASGSEGACVVLALGPAAVPSLPESDRDKLPPVSAARPAPPPPPTPMQAARQLAEARNVRELSHLVGDVPGDCLTGRGVQTCHWRIAAGEVGHGIFAAIAGAEGSVELRCRLPIDGSERPAESCLVKVSD